MLQIAKYPEEFVLEFFSVDRFIFRASDVFKLEDHTSRKMLDRLDHCHVYFLTKRPRLSLVPNTVHVSTDRISFEAEWKIKGIPQRDTLKLPRDELHDAEHSFAVSSFPHRELVSYDAGGQAIMSTLF